MFAMAVLGLVLGAATVLEPPRLIKGAGPEIAPLTVGGALVLLEVGIDADGAVDDVRTLVSVAPHTEALRAAVRRFRFRAARENGAARPARVLVAGYFRPPALLLGGRVRAPAPREMPQPRVAVPVEIVPPAYPPNAQGDAVVIVDLRLDPQGHAASASVIESAAGFDEAALAAARAWRFEMPDLEGPQAAAAVLVLVFRAPVGLAPLPPSR